MAGQTGTPPIPPMGVGGVTGTPPVPMGVGGVTGTPPVPGIGVWVEPGHQPQPDASPYPTNGTPPQLPAGWDMQTLTAFVNSILQNLQGGRLTDDALRWVIRNAGHQVGRDLPADQIADLTQIIMPLQGQGGDVLLRAVSDWRPGQPAGAAGPIGNAADQRWGRVQDMAHQIINNRNDPFWQVTRTAVWRSEREWFRLASAEAVERLGYMLTPAFGAETGLFRPETSAGPPPATGRDALLAAFFATADYQAVMSLARDLQAASASARPAIQARLNDLMRRIRQLPEYIAVSRFGVDPFDPQFQPPPPTTGTPPPTSGGGHVLPPPGHGRPDVPPGTGPINAGPPSVRPTVPNRAQLEAQVAHLQQQLALLAQDRGLSSFAYWDRLNDFTRQLIEVNGQLSGYDIPAALRQWDTQWQRLRTGPRPTTGTAPTTGTPPGGQLTPAQRTQLEAHAEAIRQQISALQADRTIPDTQFWNDLNTLQRRLIEVQGALSGYDIQDAWRQWDTQWQRLRTGPRPTTGTAPGAPPSEHPDWLRLLGLRQQWADASNRADKAKLAQQYNALYDQLAGRPEFAQLIASTSRIRIEPGPEPEPSVPTHTIRDASSPLYQRLVEYYRALTEEAIVPSDPAQLQAFYRQAWLDAARQLDATITDSFLTELLSTPPGPVPTPTLSGTYLALWQNLWPDMASETTTTMPDTYAAYVQDWSRRAAVARQRGAYVQGLPLTEQQFYGLKLRLYGGTLYRRPDRVIEWRPQTLPAWYGVTPTGTTGTGHIYPILDPNDPATTTLPDSYDEYQTRWNNLRASAASRNMPVVSQTMLTEEQFWYVRAAAGGGSVIWNPQTGQRQWLRQGGAVPAGWVQQQPDPDTFIRSGFVTQDLWSRLTEPQRQNWLQQARTNITNLTNPAYLQSTGKTQEQANRELEYWNRIIAASENRLATYTPGVPGTYQNLATYTNTPFYQALVLGRGEVPTGGFWGGTGGAQTGAEALPVFTGEFQPEPRVTYPMEGAPFGYRKPTQMDYFNWIRTPRSQQQTYLGYVQGLTGRETSGFEPAFQAALPRRGNLDASRMRRRYI